eukprot:m.183728 g.183728  ORF g.183728 m.183728 type:complete len:65 (+) comp24667_c0_seq1:2663-2857(+)
MQCSFENTAVEGTDGLMVPKSRPYHHQGSVTVQSHQLNCESLIYVADNLASIERSIDRGLRLAS